MSLPLEILCQWLNKERAALTDAKSMLKTDLTEEERKSYLRLKAMSEKNVSELKAAVNKLMVFGRR